MPDITAVTHAQNIRYDRKAEALYIIDQTLLPGEEKEIRLQTIDEMVEAIRALRVRGAPAIGICAAYCMYVLAKSIRTEDRPTFLKRLSDYGQQLDAARPTAVNLGWAIREMMRTALEHVHDTRGQMLDALYERAVAIHEDDIAKCRAISEYGLSLLKEGDGVLTHCNAGPLATSRYGTAQGPFLLAAVLIKRDGFAIGGGDMELMGACGFVLGVWPGLIQAVLSLSLAVLVGLVECRLQKQPLSMVRLPLAPFFCFGGVSAYWLTAFTFQI